MEMKKGNASKIEAIDIYTTLRLPPPPSTRIWIFTILGFWEVAPFICLSIFFN